MLSAVAAKTKQKKNLEEEEEIETKRKFISRYIKFQCDLMWHDGGKERVRGERQQEENCKQTKNIEKKVEIDIFV